MEKNKTSNTVKKMAAPMHDVLSKVEHDFLAVTAAPEDYLTLQKTNATKLRKSLKSLYDAYKGHSPKDSTGVLQELIVKDFDEEQVWQQLELQNDNAVNKLLSAVARLAAGKQKLSFVNGSNDTYKNEGLEKLKKKAKASLDNEEGVEEDDDITDHDDEDHDDEENAATDEEEEEENDIDELEEEEGEEIDKNDKFFDFTGDSDDDLNFDFGPLGNKGDINDEIFDNKESDDDDADDTETQVKGKGTKGKKSVTFKDDIEKSKDTVKEKTGGKYKEKLRSQKKETGLEKELAELEAFLDQEDKKEELRLRKEKAGNEDDEDDEGNIDMFEDLESGDEDLYYDDFFDPINDGEDEEDDETKEGEDEVEEASTSEEEEEKEEDDEMDEDEEADEEKSAKKLSQDKKSKLDLLADSESEGEDIGDILGGRREQKSTFEIRQEKLKKKISEMENELVSNNPWQMSGEISATKRPENSLLQENLQFDYTTRLPPEITEETTKTLEDLIKQRIKDKAWDDVERKVKPKDNPFEYKKRLTLDQEKSKLSLGEIYEKEYLKQQQAEEEEKEDPDHDSIKKMMQSLFLKLDALSNFHYTPKQAVAEVKIVTNQPSISMEEVAPVAMTESALLAPEEVQEKSKAEVKGVTEKTHTDRLRERKKKKAKKREQQKEREKRQKLVEKMNPGLGNKYSKEKALKKLEKESKSNNSGLTLIKEGGKEKSNRTSSKTFFTQLQEEVTTNISSKKAEKRKKMDTVKPSVKKFKL